MIKATLQRFLHNEITFGKIIFDNIKSKDIYTIERKWVNNKPNISCIPAGIYNVRKYNSSKFPDTWQLLSVPNRSAILIHAGNYGSDVKIGEIVHKAQTNGCIMVGLGIDESIPMVTRSQDCMKYLRNLLKDENFILHIKD